MRAPPPLPPRLPPDPIPVQPLPYATRRPGSSRPGSLTTIGIFAILIGLLGIVASIFQGFGAITLFTRTIVPATHHVNRYPVAHNLPAYKGDLTGARGIPKAERDLLLALFPEITYETRTELLRLLSEVGREVFPTPLKSAADAQASVSNIAFPARADSTRPGLSFTAPGGKVLITASAVFTSTTGAVYTTSGQNVIGPGDPVGRFSSYDIAQLLDGSHRRLKGRITSRQAATVIDCIQNVSKGGNRIANVTIGKLPDSDTLDLTLRGFNNFAAPIHFVILPDGKSLQVSDKELSQVDASTATIQPHKQHAEVPASTASVVALMIHTMLTLALCVILFILGVMLLRDHPMALPHLVTWSLIALGTIVLGLGITAWLLVSLQQGNAARRDAELPSTPLTAALLSEINLISIPIGALLGAALPVTILAVARSRRVAAWMHQRHRTTTHPLTHQRRAQLHLAFDRFANSSAGSRVYRAALYLATLLILAHLALVVHDLLGTESSTLALARNVPGLAVGAAVLICALRFRPHLPDRAAEETP
ncbi:MAG TPA: hypothetical protein VF669_21225 [Tepidisphaeraceae bacterium]|jgi:hypothetical protein